MIDKNCMENNIQLVKEVMKKQVPILEYDFKKILLKMYNNKQIVIVEQLMKVQATNNNCKCIMLYEESSQSTFFPNTSLSDKRFFYPLEDGKYASDVWGVDVLVINAENMKEFGIEKNVIYFVPLTENPEGIIKLVNL